MKKILASVGIIGLALGMTACDDDANVASENVSKAADNFEVYRKIAFVNGITDKYLLSIEGLCSVSNEGNKVSVICKTGPNVYKKHLLGLSDNVTYFAEQVDGIKASAYHYRVTIKPEQILPGIDVRTSQGNKSAGVPKG